MDFSELAWILLPVELIIGFACGWYLRTVTWTGRNVSTEAPGVAKPGPERYLKLLREIREGMLRHAKSVRAFSRRLADDEHLEIDVPKIAEENAEFEQELHSQIQQLQQCGHAVQPADSELDVHLMEYQELVEKFGDALSAVPDAETLKSVAGLLTEPITALLESQQALQQELQQTRNRLIEQETQLQTAQAEARRDPLTNIANRRAFEEKFAELERSVARQGKTGSLIVLDIDHFKQFNDTYGHAAGDAVLAIVGHVLHSVVPDSDMVFRIGGEEFAILLPSRNCAQAHAIAERFRSRMEAACLRFDGEDLQVTISAGVASFAPGVTREQLSKHADTALYAAKAAGRNCVISHDDEAAPLDVEAEALASSAS